MPLDSPASASRARKLRHLRLLVERRSVAYVGWLGRANLGDEAIFQAYRHALGAANLQYAPESGRILSRLVSLSPRPLFSATALGGGTLIATGPSRRAIESTRRGRPHLPLIMIGPGVEDAASDAPYANDFREELRAWVPLLKRFEAVTVRGPRSAELLDGVGVEAQVVGDPALLLGRDIIRPTTSAPRLGLNVGQARHVLGGDPSPAFESIIQVGRAYRDRGWDVRLLPVWPDDHDTTERCAAAIGGNVSVARYDLGLQTWLDEAASCTIFVGMKLHSLILANAVGTPGIMVAYHPKCVDYQRSIESPWGLSTDSINPGSLLELTDALSDGLGEETTRLMARIGVLRARLDAHALRCREVLSAAGAL